MSQVTINPEQKLYVIPAGNGYSCLGFDVCTERIKRLADEMQVQPADTEHGSIERYQEYERLEMLASETASRTGKRFECELSPQLIGKEGYRVEVVTLDGETRRFIVGKSTGWLPIHLEIARANSSGGFAADRQYRSVQVLYKSR